MFFSEHRLKIASLRIGKHRIVKNIASLRKVNIAHPYLWGAPIFCAYVCRTKRRLCFDHFQESEWTETIFMKVSDFLDLDVIHQAFSLASATKILREGWRKSSKIAIWTMPIWIRVYYHIGFPSHSKIDTVASEAFTFYNNMSAWSVWP